MKKTLYSTLLLIAFLISGQVLTYSSGPPTGYTNAPGEGDCTSCHGGASIVNSGSVWDSLTMEQIAPYGLGTASSPFTFRLRFANPNSIKYGFELCALEPSATSSSFSFGSLSVNNASNGLIQLVTGVPREYLEHTSIGTDAPNNVNTWTFDWVPPSTGFTGSVTFYVCVNSTNSDGNSTGDTIIAKSFTMQLYPTVNLNLSAFMQGLYIGGYTMTPAPFNVTGLGSNSIADTITVELHDTVTNAIKFSTPALLQTNGIANVNFPSTTNGKRYYVSISHRNSIKTWSSIPILFNSSGTNYDFSISQSKAYGNNLVDDGNGVFMIYSGDINQDGSIDFNEYPALNIASSIGTLGYDPNDLNGDASVDFNDYPIIDVNSSNGIISINP